MRQSRFSQIRERRQSLNQVIREESFDLPIPHRPGWSSQRINMVDVDIRISPGWSIVPLSDLSDLKVPLIILFSKFKGSSYPSHFILEIIVGKRRIRNRTTLKLNFQFDSNRSKMASLNSESFLCRIRLSPTLIS